MAVAIAVRIGSGANAIEATDAVHIEVSGLEAYVGVVTPKTIIANTLANPTVVEVTAHQLETGDHVLIASSNSDPVIDGAQIVTVTDADHFTVPVNVTTAGTAGTIVFTSDDDSLLMGAEKRYYLLVDAPSGTDDAKSAIFSPSSDGKWSWDGYIFPADGSYTIRLFDAADDEAVTTQAVTVDAA